jgi:hypothetical protein
MERIFNVSFLHAKYLALYMATENLEHMEKALLSKKNKGYSLSLVLKN